MLRPIAALALACAVATAFAEEDSPRPKGVAGVVDGAQDPDPLEPSPPVEPMPLEPRALFAQGMPGMPGMPAVPPPGVGQCTGKLSKTGSVRTRALMRFALPIWVVDKVGKGATGILGALGASQGFDCKPYAMLTPAILLEDYDMTCCPQGPQGQAFTEHIQRVIGQVGFQLGVSCEMPVGFALILAQFRLGSAGSVIDKALANASIIPVARIQGDFAVTPGGGWAVTPPQTCPNTFGTFLQANGVAQFQFGVQVGQEGSLSPPQGSILTIKWPPWQDKMAARASAALTGGLGATWTMDRTDWQWNPPPSLQQCYTARARFFDFIDYDVKKCLPMLTWPV